MRDATPIVLLVCLTATSAAAQAPPPPPRPVTIGGVTVTGSLRTRVEGWSWFEADADGDYAFSGTLLRLALARATPRVDWQLELAAPVLLRLPDDATAPGAQGALGLGANYFAANDNRQNAAMLFVKQGFVRVNNVGGVKGQSLRIGRMEFIDGTETVPGNATLAALKRDRIAHRLLGNFSFSHVGRSVDGAQYAINRPSFNVTALAARPTQSVFQVDGWGELKVDVFYGALTRPTTVRHGVGEWRIFGLEYVDARAGVVKTDNRPIAARRADTDRVNVFTVGGHFLGTRETRAGMLDFLMWAALQRGSWGALSHRAGAAAVEAGWQPSGAARLRPWIRGGFDYGTGDADPNDAAHGTFFQVLPTPRIYARFPFFNMMNLRDAFGEAVLRPSPRVTIRADVHDLRLAAAQDLWYSGGGAFQPGTFGYTGRPSGGHTPLALMADGSLDWALTPHVTLSGYFSYAGAREAMTFVYPCADAAQFGYLEASLRF